MSCTGASLPLDPVFGAFEYIVAARLNPPDPRKEIYNISPWRLRTAALWMRGGMELDLPRIPFSSGWTKTLGGKRLRIKIKNRLWNRQRSIPNRSRLGDD